MFELGQSSKEDADDLWRMCAQDMWFWINTFLWTYDPRLKCKKIPFITNGCQDKALWVLTEAVRVGRDAVTEKSRGVGGTWTNLLPICHGFQFMDSGNYLIGSRKAELVDKAGSPGSLFWKVDFLFNTQPTWLAPIVDRTFMKIRNEENGSVINGESTNEDFGRGDRTTITLLDEFGKVENAPAINTACAATSNTRFVNSTHGGVGTEFNRLCEGAGEFKIRMHWSEFEGYRSGLRWNLDGKISSDWYEAMCRKLPGKVQIAAELDICPIGSEALYFDAEMLKSIELNDCQQPLFTGELLFDPTGMPTKFMPTPHGRLRLWCPLDVTGLPPAGDYKFGCDIAAGTGASNTTIEGYDQKTKIQVAEFAHSKTMPEEAALYSVALCRWFGRDKDSPAELIWENQGPGATFTEAIIRNGFGNIYFSQDENKITKDRSDRPGWYNTQASKERMFGEFAVALRAKEYIVRSLELVRELGSYVYAEGRKIEPRTGGGMETDPSGARANHGDRVIGAGLSWKAASASGMITEKKDDPEIIYGTTAWYHSLHYKKEAKSKVESLYPFIASCNPKK